MFGCGWHDATLAEPAPARSSDRCALTDPGTTFPGCAGPRNEEEYVASLNATIGGYMGDKSPKSKQKEKKQKDSAKGKVQQAKAQVTAAKAKK